MHHREPLRVRPALLLRNPHFAGQWTKKVPASHVRVSGVRCHELVPLEVGELAKCPQCERHFLRLTDSVRVARWEPAELEDRYAGPGWTPLSAA